MVSAEAAVDGSLSEMHTAGVEHARSHECAVGEQLSWKCGEAHLGVSGYWRQIGAPKRGNQCRAAEDKSSMVQMKVDRNRAMRHESVRQH